MMNYKAIKYTADIYPRRSTVRSASGDVACSVIDFITERGTEFAGIFHRDAGLPAARSEDESASKKKSSLSSASS
jgi:hypothetical protein